MACTKIDEDRLLGNKMLTMSTVPHSTRFTLMLSMAVIPLCGCVGRYSDVVGPFLVDSMAEEKLRMVCMQSRNTDFPSQL